MRWVPAARGETPAAFGRRCTLELTIVLILVFELVLIVLGVMQ